MRIFNEDEHQQPNPKHFVHVSLRVFHHSLNCKWGSIIKPEGRGPSDSSDLSLVLSASAARLSLA